MTSPEPHRPTHITYTPPTVTTYKVRRQTSHTFHLIMSILTCGIWAILVWWPLTWWHKFGPRKKITQHHR